MSLSRHIKTGTPEASLANNEVEGEIMTGNSEEMPFLVTHWLANYGAASTVGTRNMEQQEALDRIRKATSEIASAFESLGAYGTAIQPSLGSNFLQQSVPENAKFSDLSRRWSWLPASHLESLAEAATASSGAAELVATNSSHVNLLHASSEATQTLHGRTLQDPIDLDGGNEQALRVPGVSSLQPPVLFSSHQRSTSAKKITMTDAKGSHSPLPTMEVRSRYSEIAKNTSDAMRQFLMLRERVRSSTHEIKVAQAAVSKQEDKGKILTARFQQITEDSTVSPSEKLEKLEEIKSEREVCERVITQLQRKIEELTKTQETDSIEIARVERQAGLWESKRRATIQNFRDPLSHPSKGCNGLLRTVLGRQQGIPRSRPIFRGESRIDEFSTARKTLLCTRLSHAATINSHLTYPVYCLRFDRTGRYFFTGADDYLVKVFYLGADQSCRTKNSLDGSRQLRCNYGANLRGAVLVCSLRGHAGVINDIDVSADNCFLATASVDGDVRVWGLRDGRPIAVLRGHKGGANMVTWSTLTPYRLVTTGADGYARHWDIREACLKRYSAIVGKRDEYRLRLTASEKEAVGVERRSGGVAENRSESLLPPLPIREGTAAALASSQNDNANAPAPGRIVVPPLPAGVRALPGPGGNNAELIENNNAPGQFVANDLIDEGVDLLAKFKHGATGDDATGPGTRSRRAAVNVICVARSPHGGHFTTGSDDGICRVWPDSEESKVEIVDRRKLETVFKGSNEPLRERKNRSENEPLLLLMGHVSAITDLSYSHAGDRILSASQKEGVIRIWSLGAKLSGLSSGLSRLDQGGIGQIVIRLTKPGAGATTTQTRTSRRPGHSSRNNSSKISCDVAIWSHDDSRILTSQSILVKQSGTEVQPGSQYLFLWDSFTGHCLMGISGAHTMQCPVVVPHPTDSSLVCTAGADGLAKVWDWETGSCVFTHENKVEFGPGDAADRNKPAGYLDGAFSPDGTSIVLTDDGGRITLLDCAVIKGAESRKAPVWMQEQYFANDYYDLVYDRHGYCIERGSERPPHLAPRGVRCNHAGSSYSDEMNESFRRLIGPMPLPEHVCRWRRNEIRVQSKTILQNNTFDLQNHFGSGIMVRRGVREYDPNSTIMIRGSGHEDKLFRPYNSSDETNNLSDSPTSGNAGNGRSTMNSSRSLSSNFRYLDYDDLVRREGNPDDDEIDSDDEEFEPAAARNSRSRYLFEEESDEDSDEDLDDDSSEEFESPRRSRRGRNEPSNQRRQRAQRRAQRRDPQFVEIGSDDEMVMEFMSTNNTPSGPYVRDYHMAGHFWRLPNGGNRVRRKWLSRIESGSSYEGRKIYTPQLGDSVVYIPRAHYDTIEKFLSLSPPWQRWPQSAVWPVVRCCVRGIRYRFPYEDYFRRGQVPICESIVAILTLEITGIPELSEDRDLPWPKPSFVEPTRGYVFEVSLFETDQCEFIFPEAQYIGRLESLERAIQSSRSLRGLEASLPYSDDARGKDLEFKSFSVTITKLNEEEEYSDVNLRGSGYGMIEVSGEGWDDQVSPWELVTAETTYSRPSLSDEDKQLVMDGLNIQLRKEDVNKYLSQPVDQGRYSDYWSMVEIEMSLLFIKRRIESNYYGSKLSVVGDVRLVKENCIKYNSIQNDLSDVANQMCDEFEKHVLSDDELALLISEDEFTRLSNISQTPDSVLPLRNRMTRRQSSLENLPQPSQHRVLRGDFEMSAAARPRRSVRSRDPTPDTEVLGRISRRRTRQRPLFDEPEAEGSGGSDESEDERKPAAASRPEEEEAIGNRRRTSRASVTKRSVYQEIDSDFDEENEDEDASNSSDDSASARAVRASSSRSRNRNGPTRSSRASQKKRSIYQESESDSDEENEDGSSVAPESPIPRSRSRNRPTRSSRAAAKRHSPYFQKVGSGSDEENEDASTSASEISVPESTARRKSPRKKATGNAGSPSRRSSRGSAKKHSPYKEVDSDFDLDQEESEEEEESEEDEVMQVTRRNKRKVPSYKEDSSDIDSDQENIGRQASRSSRKRSAAPSSPVSKRSKRANNAQLPQLKPWPDIDMKDISSVSQSVLEEIHKLDKDNIFAVPVLETYPDLKSDYLKLVESPMDLRTIEEERLCQYRSIKELQDDLNLMFKNSAAFNEAGTELWNDTVEIWRRTNQIFAEICEELDVVLPRRWRP